MRFPGGLRGRITLAAVLAMALAGSLVGAVLLTAIERDARADVDTDLRGRLDQIVRRGYGGHDYGKTKAKGREGSGGGHHYYGGASESRDTGLLAGSDTFTQVAYRGRIVDRRGDVPDGPPEIPDGDGFSTMKLDGRSWRALTATGGADGWVRVQVLTSLDPVDSRVQDIRELVLLLGLGALLLTGLAAWAATSVAVRPLTRLRTGAARVTVAADLGTPLPENEGPDEVRSLARTLNEMLTRLKRSTEGTERALLATRRFAADAGHELRTPLTGLRANLDALERNPDLPVDQRQALVREITADQERMVHLLAGLQALARGEAAESLPREDVELGDLVDAAVYEARRRHPGVEFTLIEDVGGATVHGWGGGLRLVVDNLLANAALHGRPDGRVDIAMRREDDALVLEVADDGPGIAPKDRERVLEPFTRGEETTAPGTGLGLAIVEQQVTLHGGTISLGDSRLGGLAVTVRLPADGFRKRNGG